MIENMPWTNFASWMYSECKNKNKKDNSLSIFRAVFTFIDMLQRCKPPLNYARKTTRISLLTDV